MKKLLFIVLISSAIVGCSTAPKTPAPVEQPDAEDAKPKAEQSAPKKRYEPVQKPKAEKPKVKKSKPNPAVRRLLEEAKALSAQGNQRDAADRLERALRIEPNNPTLWHNLAIVKYRANIYGQAIVFAEKSLQLAGNDNALKYVNYKLISECYRLQSKPALAEEAARKAAQFE